MYVFPMFHTVVSSVIKSAEKASGLYIGFASLISKFAITIWEFPLESRFASRFASDCVSGAVPTSTSSPAPNAIVQNGDGGGEFRLRRRLKDCRGAVGRWSRAGHTLQLSENPCMVESPTR